MRPEPVSRNTLMKYLKSLGETVEKKIATTLPDTFCLVFDGWTSKDNTHYMGMFATYASKEPNGYSKILLTFSPMGEEESLGAQEHFEFATFVLELYGKTWTNVASLIGDNCPSNKAFANKARKPLVGCASHRFNLAVKDMLEDYTNLTTKVYHLMKKLRNIIHSAKLRKMTPLRPKCGNVTRWSSTFVMMERYMKLKEFLPQLCLDDVDDLLPTAREDREIEALLERLADLDSVTKALQQENLTMWDVRQLFDTVIVEYPESATRISADSDIVHNKTFERAIVKIQKGSVGELITEEMKSVEVLQIVRSNSAPQSKYPAKIESLAERALKRQKLDDTAGNQSDAKYMDLRFIVPTSNICERLFSKAGYGLDSRRQNTLPSNFELQMFLHANNDLWGIKEVNDLLTKETNTDNDGDEPGEV